MATKKFLMRIVISISTLVLVLCEIGSAQTPSITNPIPLSPNAASIATYGNVPIGLYTGQPNFTIPLYELNTGYLKIPIALAYNYNGLKVEDYPGWVGTGWTLNTPSVITRQIRNLPDESPNGYNGENKIGLQVTDYIKSGDKPTTTTTIRQQLLRGIVDGRKDSEPDLFVFSIPGYSGKFFFDDTQCESTVKIAKTMPYQHITIKGHFNYLYKFNKLKGEIKKFEIIDERGNTFLFERKERNGASFEEDADSDSPNKDFENTWYMTIASDPFNRQINFSYRQRKIAMPPTIYERMVVPEAWAPTLIKHQSFIWEQVLDRISCSSSGQVVEFIEELEARQDWTYEYWHNNSLLNLDSDTDLERPRALAKVKILVDNKQTRDFNFKYSYFGSNARLRLDEIQETNGTTSIPPYEFFYKEGIFPRIGNLESLFSQDHWGYYTGGDKTTLMPPIHLVLDNGSDVKIDGNFRTPSPDHATVGILTLIRHPTGGRTEFLYEPNDFLGSSSVTVPFGACSQQFTSKAIASLEKDIISSFAGDEYVQDISIPAETCARFSYQLSVGNTPHTQASIWLKNKSNGTFVFNYIQEIKTGPEPYYFGSTGPNPNDIFSLAAGEYELVAFLSHEGHVTDLINISTAKARVELFTSEPGSAAAVSPNQLAGGMRIKRIKDCSIGTVSGCVTKHFKYNLPDDVEKSSGSLVEPIYYGYWATLVYGRDNSADTGTSHVFVYTSNSLLPVVNTLGNSVGYQYVTVLQDADGTHGKSVQKFVSPHDEPNLGNQEFPFPPTIDRDYRRGALLEQKDFSSTRNDIPLKQLIVSPSYQTPFSTQAMKAGFNFEFSDNLSSGGLGLNIKNTMLSQLGNYTFIPYTLESGIALVSNKQEILQDFSNNRHFQTETTFKYESPHHFRTTKKEMWNSSNDQLRLGSTYYYPDDVALIQNLTNAEINGITACPDKTAVIEEKAFRNGALQSTVRNLYAGPVLANVKQSIGLSLLQDEVLFSYDGEGNVLSFITKTGVVHSYQYGYNNKLPIAYVLNAKHTDIYYEGFETGSAGADDARAKSGKKVLLSNTFSFPSTFSSSTPATMKLSYWYWANSKWNFSGELPYSATFVAPGTIIDEVRAYPAGARMTTFCHEPGKGMITRTDENNQSQHFEFDDLGRLLHVSDQEKQIMRAYDYFYKKVR